MRCMHEAQMHEESCFLTLTYEDSKLPQYGSLNYSHFQKFMKRLRFRLGKPLRFYMCGEYGEQFSRPHFHACLFGASFIYDRVPFKKLDSGSMLYTSALLSEIWTDGFASVGELTFESAAYTARYVMKKVTGDRAEAHYGRLDLTTGEIYSVEPEFCRMSLKPGIGATWIEKYKSDVYERDYVVVNGQKCKPPRYYDKRLHVMDPESAEYMELVRYKKNFGSAEENTPARLKVREQVALARLAFKKRTLE